MKNVLTAGMLFAMASVPASAAAKDLIYVQEPQSAQQKVWTWQAGEAASAIIARWASEDGSDTPARAIIQGADGGDVKLARDGTITAANHCLALGEFMLALERQRKFTVKYTYEVTNDSAPCTKPKPYGGIRAAGPELANGPNL